MRGLTRGPPDTPPDRYRRTPPDATTGPPDSHRAHRRTRRGTRRDHRPAAAGHHRIHRRTPPDTGGGRGRGRGRVRAGARGVALDRHGFLTTQQEIRRRLLFCKVAHIPCWFDKKDSETDGSSCKFFMCARFPLARKEVCPPRHVGGLPWHVTTQRVDGLTPVAPTLEWLDDASIADHHELTRGDK